MDRVVLVGGGGHASDALGAFEDAARAGVVGMARVVGYVDDWNKRPERFSGRGVAYFGPLSALADLDATHFLVATGYPATRRTLLEKVRSIAPHLRPTTLVHPAASMGTGTTIGEGTLVLGGARCSPLVTVGRHTYLSHGVLVGHDCVIEDFVSIFPGAAVSGDTVLGAGCTIGTKASVIEGVRIGENATVGAGAVVVADVEPGVTVKGIPAR